MKFMLLVYSRDILTMMTEAGAGLDSLTDAKTLYPTYTATILRLRDGRLVTTDGPATDENAPLCGYYLVDVPDLATAIGWAAQLPITNGGIEVRQVIEPAFRRVKP